MSTKSHVSPPAVAIFALISASSVVNFVVAGHRRAEPLGADRAAMLRPSDIDTIIRLSTVWMLRHPTHPRAGVLTEELGCGAKALVLHFASVAGAR